MFNQPSRRGFLSGAAAAALSLGTFSPTAPAAAATSDIRPFRIRIPERDLVDSHRRILASRWPETETVTDLSQGSPLHTMRALARCWA
ncbi:hypothetical protein BBK82_33095 [Lentzea guizhouensis]|uniref:Epoxide hydrolase N-terminal domain-containing protein n=1 Tax=Lentzea guizhouensis TaxID=1586287 RepID=A0A1B2HR40_9PSEU|nr:hypothetical protein BBK82_33095 [Lentzea guizhouensis]